MATTELVKLILLIVAV